MKRNHIGLVVLLAIIGAALLLNPGKEKHVEALLSPSPLIPAKSLDGVFKYHNYYLFSTTTDVFTNERRSFGIMGLVFK
jgi:hypothetical protein